MKSPFFKSTIIDPDPPHDVHLAAIDTNRLTFSWSPVLSNCSIGYRITSMDCIACPNFTLDTTVNCAITTNRIHRQDQMCTFYVQSVICGNYTGNQSSLTVKLKGKVIDLKPAKHAHCHVSDYTRWQQVRKSSVQLISIFLIGK